MKNFLPLSIFALTLSFSYPVFSADPETDHKVEHKHDHKHGKKCGHKAEQHKDHVDYKETQDGKTHHHKAHKDHYDECDGPESESSKS